MRGDKPTIIAGDLNAKHTSWGSRVITPAGRLLYGDAEDKGYEVLGPEAPTHVPSNPRFNPDVLDIALVKNVGCPVNVEVLYDLDTEHLPILITLGLGVECVRPPSFLRTTDWDVYKAALSEFTFSGPLSTPAGVEAAAQDINNNIVDAFAAATSERPRERRRYQLPLRLQGMLERKRRLRKLWVRTRCPQVKRDLNALAEKLSVEMAAHRGTDWETRIDQAGESETSLHQLNRQLTRTRAPACPLEDRSGIRRHAARDRADILAEHLVEQFSPHPMTDDVIEHCEQVEARVAEFISGPTPLPVGFEFISPSEARKAVLRLPNRKAPGPDQIPNMALKQLPHRALVSLTRLFNGILRTGHFPTIWKRGKVIALPKPGKDRRLPASYRPITLLSSLSKLFERLALVRIRPSLNLRDEQYGFRAGHSTTLQLTRVIHHLCEQTNRDRHTVGVFLDIEKAFDRVWHAGLIHKLLDSPLPAMLVRLIASYVNGREFYVSVESSASDPRPICAGVPQGSVLSPSLYAFYTNDIPTLDGHLEEWERDVVLALFADDSAFFASSLSVDLAVGRMQRLLDILSTWLNKWRIAVNVGKTVPILFSRKRIMPAPLRLFGEDVRWQPTVKYLGCHIDRSLRMAGMVEHVLRQARTARALLRPVLTSRLPTRTKLGIYKCYIRSRLTYAAPAWFVLVSAKQRKRLQAQQNIALRTIVRAGRYVRNTTLARDLKVESLSEFIVRLARNMFARADNGPHPHLRGIAPLHARPPEGRALPRELIE